MEKIKRMHFVGIYGVAMSALAIIAKEKGINVTGSDVEEEFPTASMLRRARIRVAVGFRKEHIPVRNPPDLVIYTGAHDGRENPEVQEAVRRGIRIMAHGEALGEIMKGKKQISVAGSHGKTTTAAMVAVALTEIGRDPSYAVGCGEIFGIGAAGHFGRGDFFVAEADEYVTDPGHDKKPRFLWQSPEFLIVTNIDYDHPDVYENIGQIQAAFLKLRESMVGQKVTIVCADDPHSAVLLPGADAITFGFSPTSDIMITYMGVGRDRTFFSVAERGVVIGDYSLKVPGKHNVLNAASVIALLRVLGFSSEAIRRGLLKFGGTKRRFEKIGSAHGVTVYDDYAHHPKEIEATLRGVRSWYPDRRIITVFQPHTYSRTIALLGDFARAFGQSDIALFTEIYASKREETVSGIDGKKLAEEARKHHPRAVFVKDYEETLHFIADKSVPGDLLLFMGAGDIYSWGKRTVADLKEYSSINV